MLQYKSIKKRYFKLKELYGGNQYTYKMDPRGINYYINFTIPTNKRNSGNWQIKVGNPNIPKSSCNDINVENKDCKYLQEILNSITIESSNGKRTYVSGLDYDVYKGNIIQHLEYYFTLKPVWGTVSTRSKPTYSPQSWIYLDYALIKKYTSDIKSLLQLPPRITNNSSEMTYTLLNDSVNEKWALLSHSAYFIDNDTILCDEHKYNFKYFIPVFDESIKTIFDFTNKHIGLLNGIKTSVANWIISNKWNNCGYDEKMKEKIRFYTLFPNQEYLYPFFIVDYYDETNISYTRIVDESRMILLDDIIEILEKNNNMKKYFVKYYIPRNSSLFILAQNEIKKTLQLFFHICGDMLIHTGGMMKNSFAVLGNEDDEDDVDDEDDEDDVDDDKDIKEIEDENIEAIIKQKLEQNSQYTELTHEFNIATYINVLDIVENYKYLYYFWKCLLDNDNYYSFVTQWNTLLKKPIEHKQKETYNKFKNRKSEGTEKNEEEKKVINLSDYTVNMVYFDGTRGTSPFRTIVGLVCQKNNEFYQINIITDKLFKDGNLAYDTEFPMIGEIKNKLVDDSGDVILREGIDNSYYGKGVNNGTIPCIIEIHKLPGNLNFIYNTIKSNNKYQDYIYSYEIFKNPPTKENAEIIKSNLDKFRNIKLDSKEMPLLLALILYRYTYSGVGLKANIPRNLLDNIPEDYIFFHPDYPFIVIPDLALQKTYMTIPNKFKLQIDNFDMVIWHADKNIYDKAITTEYKDGKTIATIINELTANKEYPFIEGKIGKFLINPDENKIEFPHTFRYTPINLLDKMYIFLNYYYDYVYKKYKLDLKKYVTDLYFHNASKKHTILHLHVNAKNKKAKLRHIYGGVINNIEYSATLKLDDIYKLYLMFGPDYYKTKNLFSFERTQHIFPTLHSTSPLNNRQQ